MNTNLQQAEDLLETVIALLDNEKLDNRERIMDHLYMIESLITVNTDL